LKNNLYYSIRFFSRRNYPFDLLGAIEHHPGAARYLYQRTLFAIPDSEHLQILLLNYPMHAPQLLKELAQQPKHLVRLCKTLGQVIRLVIQCSGKIDEVYFEPLLQTIAQDHCLIHTAGEVLRELALARRPTPLLRRWWFTYLQETPGEFDKYVVSTAHLNELIQVFPEYRELLLHTILYSRHRFARLIKTIDEYQKLCKLAVAIQPTPLMLSKNTLQEALVAQVCMLEIMKIQALSRLLAQAQRDCSGVWGQAALPVELVAKIATQSIDTQVLTPHQQMQEAYKSLERCRQPLLSATLSP
jgi:hypothetical protein